MNGNRSNPIELAFSKLSCAGNQSEPSMRFSTASVTFSVDSIPYGPTSSTPPDINGKCDNALARL